MSQDNSYGCEQHSISDYSIGLLATTCGGYDVEGDEADKGVVVISVRGSHRTDCTLNY